MNKRSILISSAYNNLKLDTAPEVRVDFKIKNDPSFVGPQRVPDSIKGIEYISEGPVEAEIIRVRELIK